MSLASYYFVAIVIVADPNSDALHSESARVQLPTLELCETTRQAVVKMALAEHLHPVMFFPCEPATPLDP